LHNSLKINDKTSFYYVYVLFLFHKTGCISAIQVNLIAFDLHCFCLDTKEKDTKKKKSRLHFLATSQFSGTKRTRYAQTAFCPYPKIAAFRFTLRK